MSNQIHSQDLNSDDLRKTWEEMDQIEPLTPISDQENKILQMYREAAEWDEYLFGDYDYYGEWMGKSNSVDE